MAADPSKSPPHTLVFVALLVALSSAATTFSSSTPILAAFLGQEWHYAATDIGWVVTAFTIGSTLGALAVAEAIRGWHVRTILWWGMVLTIVPNVLAAFHPAFGLALAYNLVAGLGSGAANSAAVGYLVYGPTPHRDLAALTVVQNLFSAFLLQFVIPHFPDGAQSACMFALMALVMLVALPAARCFHAEEVIPHAFLDGPVRPLGVALILLCMFFSFASAGVVWTFMAQHAQASGLSEGYVSNVLTATNLVSLAACLGVTWMARRGLYRWCFIVMAVGLASALMLTLPVTPWRFAIASCAFVTSWTVGSVMVPTLLPAYDPVGRRSALTPAAFGLGYAVGSLGGGLLGDRAGLQAAFVCAAALAALSLLALAGLRMLRAPAGEAPAPVPVPSAN